MRKWKHAVGQVRIDLMDGAPNLLDLRFDVLIFSRSRPKFAHLIDSLMNTLELVDMQVFLLINKGY